MSLWNLITDRTAADLQRLRELFAEIEATATPTAAQLDELKNGLDPKMIDPDKIQFIGLGNDPLFLLGQNQNGSYGAADLNRVGTAINSLVAVLAQLPTDIETYAAAKGVAWDVLYEVPYTPPVITARTDWVMEDENSTFDADNSPTTSYMGAYLGYVKTLRSCIAAAYPNLPESMENLDYNGANAIERVLFMVDEAAAAEEARLKALIDHAAKSWFYSAEIYCGE